MNLPPLLIAGLACAALVFLYTGGRLIAPRTAWTLVQLLLAGLAIALTFIGMALNAAGDAAQVKMPVAAAAILLIAGGLIFAMVQRRLDRTAGWNQSSGLALVGVGVILALTLVLAPFTASLMPTTTQAYPVVTLADQAQGQSQQMASRGAADAPARERIATAAEVRQFAVTPLPTQYVYATPAPTADAPDSASGVATEASVVDCRGTVQNNLNLRRAPSVDAERILTVPYATLLTIHARSEDGAWLWADYDDAHGWVSADYVVLSESCGALPTRES
ncbi:MAG: SH3 domain-containing protein [Anaerolineae bacterium]|nr:SH3 domain-containing protein [Anaerolineae bacterium]